MPDKNVSQSISWTRHILAPTLEPPAALPAAPPEVLATGSSSSDMSSAVLAAAALLDLRFPGVPGFDDRRLLRCAAFSTASRSPKSGRTAPRYVSSSGAQSCMSRGADYCYVRPDTWQLRLHFN